MKIKLTQLPIEESISAVNEELSRMEGQRSVLRSELKDCKNNIAKLEREIKLADQCIEVFQLLSELKKKQVKKRIEDLVTKGLQTIFENKNYRFEIEMEQKRGVMTAKPLLHSKFDDKEFSSEIVDGHGGGIVNVVSFILQVIVLLAVRPKLSHVMVCDEPFENVSVNHLPNVAAFLKYLNEITGMQFILITHKQEFLEVADKKFRVSLNKKGETIIKQF